MTEQEQKAFDQMREALEHIQRCIGFDKATIHQGSATWCEIDDAITAANAVSAEQEISRFKAVMLKHKDSACPLCEGTGEAQSVQKHPILQLWEDESQAIIDAGWTERTKAFAPQEKNDSQT